MGTIDFIDFIYVTNSLRALAHSATTKNPNRPLCDPDAEGYFRTELGRLNVCKDCIDIEWKKLKEVRDK